MRAIAEARCSLVFCLRSWFAIYVTCKADTQKAKRLAAACIATQDLLRNVPEGERTVGGDIRSLVDVIRRDEAKVHVEVGPKLQVCGLCI